ncbi:hypothetical protein C1Y40_05784 [Mycobacterium talmoniae]|uniref:Uncharacterized protein n=1 Tax=Mycobacterium talmoniae TaxID=1858794 RepID=A0A2S8BBM3_9MYCO|nr:hypothetical protein C1Y40_05784 [Mycobacterium talmoniae]
MRHQHRGGAFPGRERGLAGQQPKQRAAQRIHVGAPVKGLSRQRLRGGVGDRGHHRFGFHHPHIVQGEPNAEVAQQHRLVRAPAGGQQKVGRFEVAVHDVVGVGEIECLGHLPDDVHRALRRHRAGAQRRLGVGAVDELRRDPQPAVVGLPQAVHRHDLRMGQRGGRVGVVQEPGAEIGVLGQVGGDDLHRVPARQRRMGRRVHRTHAARAEDAFDAVPGDHGAGRQHAPGPAFATVRSIAYRIW